MLWESRKALYMKTYNTFMLLKKSQGTFDYHSRTQSQLD